MAKQSTHVPVKTKGEITRWSPSGLFDQFDRDFEPFWGGSWFPRLTPFRGTFPERWMPSTDVFQQNGDLVVKADLPGLKKEDVEVFIEDGDLVLQGERKQETETKEGNFYRSERNYGNFYRRFALPPEADATKVGAKFTDGVLEVKVALPRLERKTQKVKIA